MSQEKGALIRLFSLCLVVFFGCNPKEAEQTSTLFTRIDQSVSGVSFNNSLKESETLNIITYEYFYNGGGVAIGDINNDDLPDIYFTSNQNSNKLYLNKGNFQFEDITDKAGVSGNSIWTNGVTMADVNGDGLLDIYVCNSGKDANEDQRRNELFINNGDLTFTNQAKAFGLDDPSFSTHAMFLDIDLDNDLDMFLINRPTQPYRVEGALAVKKKESELAGDKLFLNNNGQFEDISKAAGIHRNGLGYGLGLTAGDLNKDGLPDIYVANDYIEPDYMYINNGDGTFNDMGMTATNHMSNFGMGVDIADINNDQWPDILVADMAPNDNYRQKTMMKPMNPEQFNWAVKYGFHYQYMFNTLQLNNGDMSFSDVAQMAGIATTDWSWATLFADFDNDEWNDLLITNGFRKEFSNKDFVKKADKKMGEAMNKSLEERMDLMNELLQELPETKLSNFVFKNTGDLGFSDMTNEWGLDIPTYSNGASIADLDNDGDLDIVINNIDEPAHIYQNNTNNRSSLQVKLNGPVGNTSGIGSKLELYTNSRVQYRELFLSRGYQSSVEDIVHFGISEQPDSMRVIWPDGKTQAIPSPAGRLVVDYNDARQEGVKRKTDTSPLFENITKKTGLAISHIENPHNDYGFEVLLPHKMSQFGPAFSVGDFNGDGLDDFYIGGASGIRAKLAIQQADGSFEDTFQRVFQLDAVYEDVGAEFIDIDGDNDLDLYVSSGGNEWFPDSDVYQDRLYINENGELQKAALPAIKTSNSVVRPSDLDGDGDLDLFIAGRLSPLQYPLPTKSWILINENGTYTDQTDQYNTAFKKLGMITDAQWGDLNGDGNDELVVVGEWTTIRVFSVEQQKLVEITNDLGLEALTGWWYSVRIADINNDGLNDIVGGNLGLNYKYKASSERPFHVFFNDFDGNGRGDIVLGYHDDEGELYPLRGRQCSSEQIPSLTQKFKTYDEFGKATLEEVYGENKLEKSIHYEAQTFASCVLINNGGEQFKRVELPRMAQVSSINSMIIEDFNGDGNPDILYAGNLYPVEIETTRNDASYGGLLLGDGNGNFDFVNAVNSGFKAEGDVKHLTTIQLADKSLGILVARNSGRLELFKYIENEKNI